MKTVQVLMSSYNGEKYIREQIDSILAQRGVSVKLLVRDDGSTDSTCDILKEYENKNLLEVIYGENVGVIKSFLTLVDECNQADYYAYSDQDDVWMPDKLVEGVTQLEKNDGGIPLLYCSALQRVNEKLEYQDVQSFRGLKINIYSALVRERLAGCTFVFNNMLRELLNGSSKLNINYPHDSWTLLMCYACGGKVIFDCVPHILFRRYGTNVSVDGGNIKKRIKHELRYLNKCKNQRFEVIKVLNEFRQEDIKEQEIFNQIIHYKESIWNTIKFAFNKKMDCGIKVSNWINKYVILRRCF